MAQIERICHLGIKEINLTGVNLGDFGRKSGTDFYQLLAAVERRGFDTRIRISSIEPNLLTDDIIALAAQSNVLMPHFHIPLQSPNDRILGLMRRRYQRDFFASKVLKVKEVMPHACIALDVIAGFPTETEEEFAEGLAFLESLPISYLHVFTYSRRPGTIAAEMEGQVAPQVKKERTNRLIALSEQKKTEFYRQHVGDVRPVLWEAEKKGGEMFGFTDNYIKLKIPYCKENVNTIEDVEIRRERLAF